VAVHTRLVAPKRGDQDVQVGTCIRECSSLTSAFGERSDVDGIPDEVAVLQAREQL
jgi:hypothetical protein